MHNTQAQTLIQKDIRYGLANSKQEHININMLTPAIAEGYLRNEMSMKNTSQVVDKFNELVQPV